jgi:hypothetical protein
MRLRFEVVDNVLPIRSKNVFVVSVKTLINLFSHQPGTLTRCPELEKHTFAQAPV